MIPYKMCENIGAEVEYFITTVLNHLDPLDTTISLAFRHFIAKIIDIITIYYHKP